MSTMYNHKAIEKKWQAAWEKEKIWEAKEDTKVPKSGLSADRFYVLDMFPYPSAQGLHVGHPEGYTASDIVARYLRMTGKNVLHPMGFDSFGLPTENYAIKTGTHPAVTTGKNIETMRRQIKALGFSYDWSREVITSDQAYYKWTQWIFVQLFKHGLVYEADAPINWCPSCKTGLANEEVVNGKCERCGTEVTKKQIKQWLVKITDEKYIERLLNDLDDLDWPESIKLLQKNWIGKSEGAEVDFEITASSETSLGSSPCLPAGRNDIIKVFTTRPDTLFGATYMVLAPEHTFVNRITTPEQKREVAAYVKKAQSKSDLERTDLAKEKTGVFIGAYAINPVNDKKIPIWIADYVLASYGTGAIMAVPAHDERDFEFATKFKLPIVPVVKPATNVQKHCVLVHGSPSGPDEFGSIPHERRHWFGWLQKQLAADRYVVDAPEMPVPWNPDYEAWKKEFEKINLTGDTVLVGHSAGGAFLVRWLSETKRRVRKLILVAAGKTATDDNVRLHDFYDFKIDESIKNRVDEIVIYISDDEKEYRKESAALYCQKLSGQLITLKKRGHFTVKDNAINNEFPELLSVLKSHGAFTGDGTSINSGKFDGLATIKFKKKITAWLEKNGSGKAAVNYKLRDWLFSRQRYWGEPIPIIHCEKCGNVAVPEKDLPVELPDIKNYKPTGTGESPLAAIDEWVNTKCPECGGKAKRETNTMPQWAGSNWYFLRYCDPHNSKKLADPEKLKAWLPVDLYVGGAEHAVLHLLYTRFIYKFLFDVGVVPKECGDEPFKKLKNQGLIMGEDGVKMSKSRGNVINPDDVIKEYGADVLRMYEMFMGPFEDSKPWSTKGIIGIKRFLDRVWVTFSKIINDVDQNKLERKNEVSRAIHKAIKGVTKDIERLKFNTAISWLMIFFNQRDWGPKLNSEGKWEAVSDIGIAVDLDAVKKFLKILSPFAPHISEELWERLSHKDSIFMTKWPDYDQEKVKRLEVTYVIQVNGKKRGTLSGSISLREDELCDAAIKLMQSRGYIKKIPKRTIRTIFVAGKIINFVV